MGGADEEERERESQVRNIIIVDSCSLAGRGSVAPDTRAKLNEALRSIPIRIIYFLSLIALFAELSPIRFSDHAITDTRRAFVTSC